MAFRGRGRGRGGGRSSRYDQHVKHQPYVLFPEEVSLPSLPEPPKDKEMDLITSKVKLEYFWKGSCYHLEEAVLKLQKNDFEIERYSDRFKLNKQRKREALSSYLKLAPSNFPAELIQGSRRVHNQDPKKLRWDRDTEAKMLESWEKLEENSKGNKNDDKEKKDEDEEGEEVEEEAEEDSEDDYNQNEYFDDDEDDLNMEEEEFEDAYE